jgi:pimeloyl-ACP methyl ester carboxylesterase
MNLLFRWFGDGWFRKALAILCIFALPVLAQSARPQGAPVPIGKLVDVGGYKVHVYCVGSGSPAVVIVGAGFSFNWGLVQPEVAKFTQICAYDHSGIGWSEDGPADSCSLRVNEVHTALKNLGIKAPYVLVGHSHGGMVARIYAGKYPDETAGIVFVDHAVVHMSLSGGPKPPNGDGAISAPSPPQLVGGGKVMGIEDDPNFSKMSERDRQLQLWFMAQPRDQAALRANPRTSPECIAQADEMAKAHPYMLGDKPLVDVDTDEMRDVPGYVDLQKQLLALSHNGKEIIAENSSHFIMVDRPDVVIEAIRRAVESVRNNSKL